MVEYVLHALNWYCRRSKLKAFWPTRSKEGKSSEGKRSPACRRQKTQILRRREWSPHSFLSPSGQSVETKTAVEKDREGQRQKAKKKRRALRFSLLPLSKGGGRMRKTCANDQPPAQGDRRGSKEKMREIPRPLDS